MINISMFKAITFIILLLGIINLPTESIAHVKNKAESKVESKVQQNCFPRKQLLIQFQQRRMILIQRAILNSKSNIIMEIYARPLALKNGRRIYGEWAVVFVKRPNLLTCIMAVGELLADTNPFGIGI